MNKEVDIVNIKDVPVTLLEDVATRANWHSAVLVRGDNNGGWGQAGSGTFIHYKGSYFILTAGHVAREFRDAKRLGLSITKGNNLFYLDMSLIEIEFKYDSKPEGVPPDIGVLKLPGDVVGTIEARDKIFYHLDGKVDDAVTSTIDLDNAIWFVWGAPRERTKQKKLSSGRGVAEIYECQAGVTGVAHRAAVGKYDLLAAGVDYNYSPGDAPLDLQGYSGGGLWKSVIVKDSHGQLAIDRVCLSGVVFFQTAVSECKRELICHGPRGMIAFLDEAVGGIA